MTLPRIELVSHELCPYVQRAVIVLEEKGIPYRRTDIDLANKPDWFLRQSPLGKVPLLLDEGRQPIFESAVICEYLDEITPGNMLPEDAAEKARHRSWIEFGSGILNLIGTLYSARDEAAFEAARRGLRRAMEWLATAATCQPYFAGDRFTMVDAVYGPVFRYFDVFDRWVDLALFQDLDDLEQWRGQLRNRASVQQAVRFDYDQRLTGFVTRRGGFLAGLMAGTADV